MNKFSAFLLWIVLPCVVWCFQSQRLYGKCRIPFSCTVMRLSPSSPVNKFKYLLDPEMAKSTLRPFQNFLMGRRATTVSPFTLSFEAESPISKLKEMVQNNPLTYSGLVEDKGERQLMPQPPSTPPFTGTPDQLIVKAREVIASDLAILSDYHDIIDDEFKWIGPYSYGKPLGKEEYIAAGQFFNLRSTFPDLDYRAYDYRISSEDPYTVRATCRVVGTMRGDLRLRSETLPPNGKRMFCPPEAISMTFDPQTGKLKKLCSGFTMDRLVGNTKGLCGVMAAAVIAGSEPSEWDIYPPKVVLQRFFNPSVKQTTDINPVDEPLMASFPESVLIKLAKGVIAASNGASDPDLLAPTFTFCSPLVGPIDKDSFLTAMGNFDLIKAFPDLDVDFSNFRVDPYDPCRVWADVRATDTGTFLGISTGNNIATPPEAVSFTFDAEGFCTRLTAGAIMDPSAGNVRDLGGIFGRVFPEVSPSGWPNIMLQDIQKNVVSSLAGKGVDEYVRPASQAETPVMETESPLVEEKPSLSISSSNAKDTVSKASPLVWMESLTELFSTSAILNTQTEVKVTPTPPAISPPPKESSANTSPLLESSLASFNPQLTQDNPTDSVTDVFKSLFGLTRNETSSVPFVNVDQVSKAKTLAEQKKDRQEIRKKPELVSDNKVQNDAVTDTVKTLLGLGRPKAKSPYKKEKNDKNSAAITVEKKTLDKQKMEKIATLPLEQPKKQGEKKSKDAAAQQEKQAKAILNAKPGGTIRLFDFFVGRDDDEVEDTNRSQTTEPPKGVPNLSKWRKNLDGSVSGIITGSKAFNDGEAITTSPLKGDATPGSVVMTQSGSRYFLKEKSGFSFFGMATSLSYPGLEEEVTDTKTKRKEAPLKAAKRSTAPVKPKDIPSLSRWKKISIGKEVAITGKISGSSSYSDGTEITTSSIASGEIISGSVVKTTSGSKYFLS